MGGRHFLIFIFRKLFRVRYLLVLLFLLALSYFLALSKLPDGLFHADFLDIGQGDAILLVNRKNQTVLVDGGPAGAEVERLLNERLPWGKRDLDLVILTHPHADHVAGLTAVLQKFRVANIAFNSQNYDTQTFARFLSLAAEQKSRGARVFSVSRGDLLTLSDLKILILWPPRANYHDANPNNESIVALASEANFDLLLPGDQETTEAEKMMARGPLTPVEVLKVAHHGSSNGLNEKLLNELQPQLAVISSGRGNPYGHPHPSTLNLLREFKIPTRRTDLNGTIEVISDGQKWSFRSQR